MAGSSQGVQVGLRSLGPKLLLPAARRTVITGPGPLAENYFDNPMQVHHRAMKLPITGAFTSQDVHRSVMNLVISVACRYHREWRMSSCPWRLAAASLL